MTPSDIFCAILGTGLVLGYLLRGLVDGMIKFFADWNEGGD